jgi:hypothetical protein
LATPFVTVAEAELTASTRGTAIVTAACDLVRLFTEQDIYPAVTGGTALLDGTGTETLLLPQLPVLNAGTVIENVTSPSPGTLTLNTDYKLSDNGELYRLPGLIDSGWSTGYVVNNWWPGRQNIQVVYSYGYALADVPPDLKEVAIQMAKRLSSQNGNVVFEQIGQRQIRYDGPATDFTNTEKLVLRRYKQAR